MHTLILDKTTQIILQSRYETSTGRITPADEVLQAYCEGSDTDSTSVEIIEIPFTKFDLEIGKHIYNKTTSAVEISPTWVEPARESTIGIPTTDTSTNTTVNG